jgi:hypothetical protein
MSTLSTFDDPIHLRTNEPCEWCNAPWVPIPHVADRAMEMEHSEDCAYYQWYCDILDDPEDIDMTGVLGDDIVPL